MKKVLFLMLLTFVTSECIQVNAQELSVLNSQQSNSLNGLTFVNYDKTSEGGLIVRAVLCFTSENSGVLHFETNTPYGKDVQKYQKFTYKLAGSQLLIKGEGYKKTVTLVGEVAGKTGIILTFDNYESYSFLIWK